jgi:hypothetical protein
MNHNEYVIREQAKFRIASANTKKNGINDSENHKELQAKILDFDYKYFTRLILPLRTAQRPIFGNYPKSLKKSDTTFG